MRFVDHTGVGLGRLESERRADARRPAGRGGGDAGAAVPEPWPDGSSEA
jgi:hypothetical protein